MALDHLVGHTPAGSQYRSLFLAGMDGGGIKNSSENDIIRDLKLLCRDHPVRLHVPSQTPNLITPGRLLHMMPLKP
jgi:hypothetical protein